MNQEIKDKILYLRNSGMTTHKIAEELNLAQSTICYWLGSRESTIIRNKKRYRSLSKEEKRVLFKKNYPYLKNYLKERYNNDPVFRRKHIERVKRYKESKK